MGNLEMHGHSQKVSTRSTENDLKLDRNHHTNSYAFQVSEDGNVSTSVLSITPTREDHGKALSCRATNELVRNGIRETAMKLNVFCK